MQNSATAEGIELAVRLWLSGAKVDRRERGRSGTCRCSERGLRRVSERPQFVARDYQRVSGAYESDLAANRPGSIGMVAGDHDDRDAGFAALPQRLRHLGTRRILQARQPGENEIFFHLHALPLCFQRPVGHGNDP